MDMGATTCSFFLQNPDGAPPCVPPCLQTTRLIFWMTGYTASFVALSFTVLVAVLTLYLYCSTTNHTRKPRPPSIITIIMPSRKSVRFEDLDDGAEDGVYGLKVCYTRGVVFKPVLLRALGYVWVSTLSPLLFLPGCMRHSSPIPPLTHTVPPPLPIPSNHTGHVQQPLRPGHQLREVGPQPQQDGT